MNRSEKKLKSILDDYDKHIQAQSLNFLFKAVDYDEAELAEEIRRYLSEHYYASVNPPRGNTLREKLISTDWRHLSWWEKEQAKSNPEPAGGYGKTRTDYSAPPVIGGIDSSNRPPAAPRPETPKPPQMPPPEPPKKGGLSDAAIIGLSVLTVIFLVWIVMRLVRVNQPDPLPKKPAKELNESPPGSEKSRIKPPKSQRPKKKPDASKEKASLRAANYDEIDDRAGEFGLRPARQGERWGYIDESNKWTIKPQFDLATPFNSGKASVEIDGIQFFIDRYGARIKGNN